MEAPSTELKIEESGDRFALVLSSNGSRVGELALTAIDLINLPRVIQAAMPSVLRRLSSREMAERGASLQPSVSVTNVNLNTSVDGSHLLLGFTDVFGNQSSFAIPRDIAEPLSKSLQLRVTNLR